MSDRPRQSVLFVCEKYFLRFYRPLAERLRRSGFTTVWVAVDGFDEWQGESLDPGAALEELSADSRANGRTGANAPWDFERAIFARPDLSKANYPYTLNVVRTPERAQRLAAAWYDVTLALLARVRPRATFVWNGRYLPYSAVSAACSAVGQPLLTSEIGWIPGTIFLERGGLSASAMDLGGRGVDAAPAGELGRADAFLHDYTTRRATMVSQPLRAPAEVRAQLLGADGRFVLLYGCQVEWDTNVIIGSRRFRTNDAAIAFLLECLSTVPGGRLVVKTHPLDSDKNETVLRQLVGDRGMVISDVHPHVLIEAADCVSVRNSTLGFEALCYGKPLLLLEPAKYEHPGLTLPARTAAEGAESLASVSDGRCRVPDPLILQAFILHAIDRYLVPVGYRYYFEPDKLEILSHFGHNQSLDLLEQLLRDAPVPGDVSPDASVLRALDRCTWRRPPHQSFFSRQARRISEWLG